MKNRTNIKNLGSSNIQEQINEKENSWEKEQGGGENKGRGKKLYYYREERMFGVTTWGNNEVKQDVEKEKQKRGKKNRK